MTSRETTSAERLPDHLAGRLADIRAMLARDDPDEGDDELPGLYEYPLGVTVRYALRVELSTGGPADYITATADRDGAILDARYHFADWYDHASCELVGDDLDTAEAFLAALVPLDNLAESAD